MKQFTIVAIGLVALAGCTEDKQVTGGKLATLQSVHGFTEALLAELRKAGPVTVGSGGSGGSTNYAHDWHEQIVISLPSTIFAPEALCAATRAAEFKWGMKKTYSSHGGSCGGNLYTLQYGNGRSQAMLDAIAYIEGEETKINIMIHIVE